MTRTLLLFLLALLPLGGFAQQFTLIVVKENAQPADGATVKLMQANRQVSMIITNARGQARFQNIAQGTFSFSVTYTGYQPLTTRSYTIAENIKQDTIRIQALSTALKEVNITAKTPPVEVKQGKVIVNVDASVTNVGATVLEVLEKSPGVMVDRNGGISLQGKPGVLVMIDGKPTYLSGADLNNLLSSMSSTQVAQIELIANPTARYDASGNAGIINIKTKKNRQKGFNGSVTATAAQGVYFKTNNTLTLNYRAGRVSTFFNYNISRQKYLTNLYALRKYTGADGATTATLDQPSHFTGTLLNNTAKAGLDYEVSPKTTVGIVLGGTMIHREGNNTASARWLNSSGAADSVIATDNANNSRFKNGQLSLSLRHTISKTQDISADADWLHYNITSDQNFNNRLQTTGGYNESTRANIPTGINIFTGKADYTLKTDSDGQFQAGWKSAHSSTDNSAGYQNLNADQWTDDLTRSNHFLYSENIHAVYTQWERKRKAISYQLGLRYEHTDYHAHQLGNVLQKDSAFSRNYGSFFPSGYFSYQADTANSFTLTVSRRIDRPVYQTLNPFYFIINKYTYQTGNPYILPQYSWNLELSHQYKNLLTTTLSYSNINNYFSQIFLSDPTLAGILLYTQGNVGRTYIIGVSEAITASPTNWWTLTAQALYNYKKLSGFNGNHYTSDINQLNLNASNQFTIGKRFTGELSGFYTTRARNDVQERLYPTGQLSAGLGMSVLKKKATLKLSMRDIFYTNAMEGLTQFPNATEYFKIKRDSRVVVLAFTYRFGKTFKTAKRDNGVTDEMQRVGNG
ncbi:outer membrane beta-barrel protein [Mucilaginibacter rubeus]|uniref:Outer membrane beta-barrel protein n=1 Tax=Mucilaginibacter rubeus TaxID=2027860 RepID=A0AAE6MHF6_9SPHI|nr:MULTISPECIES: outer membrane beta-barrel protein [Mucilaginibacter]QEM03486.1 outer membrane beta-barrel protein [Mucilaginibacter rubeus]QEM16101.1 outer membrane beta-barrel protein [Mucilaginibacter gossypii]QTE41146.1 TonB-dependent receptor [Mucilaginibacter rubeus]QTE47749.1 TonB-dependent receptor [Mucilaginibacter rubeus]QTE59140.1 TonB-dependent receptor [Mucilaginibacter rubeus]